jgi:glucokinase
MGQSVFVGVDIGGTKTSVSVAHNPPLILWRAEFPTLPEKGPDHAIEGILQRIREGLDANGQTLHDIASIGVSCGSPLDSKSGVILAPPNLSTWKAVPIKQLLEDQFGVPCYVENDANAAALAEFHFGAGQGMRNVVFLTMGTGLGAGIILNGQLYRGSGDAAGEIGHVRLSASGPVGHGKAGSVEGWASGGGMAQVAAKAAEQALADGKSSALGNTVADFAQMTAKHVWEAAQAGDKVACDVIQTSGERLGEAIAILVDILNPDRVIVGGLALRMGDAILEPARTVVRTEALQANAERCAIVSAALGEQLGDIAALCVALQDGLHGSLSQYALMK